MVADSQSIVVQMKGSDRTQAVHTAVRVTGSCKTETRIECAAGHGIRMTGGVVVVVGRKALVDHSMAEFDHSRDSHRGWIVGVGRNPCQCSASSLHLGFGFDRTRYNNCAENCLETSRYRSNLAQT